MVLDKLGRYFKKSKGKGPGEGSQNDFKASIEETKLEDLKELRISSKLNDNLNLLQALLGRNEDVVFRCFRLGINTGISAFTVYIENMVDKIQLNNNIIKPLMLDSLNSEMHPYGHNLGDIILDSILAVSNVTEIQEMSEVMSAVLSGGVVLIVDGLVNAFIIDIRRHSERAIEQPEDEVLVRGPREGFVETLRQNIVLIRRHVRSPQLIFENMNIGRVTATDVSVVYIKGITSPELVKEVKERLQRIDIDGILESGYLEEFIEDNPYSPFPQIVHTERPDRASAALLQGRVVILTDGTPFALIVPAELSTFITSPEDYYERYFLGTAIRWVRLISFAISLVLPSIYIAITTFHPEMIPTRLLISISSYRQGLPFPTLVEALLMEFTFEILREAGVRLPRSIGQAVSIVGALVIGQSAVQAGIVSPLMVIIVAFTGIASFTFPSYNLGITIRLLRFPLMLLAGTLGLFGVMIGIIVISVHMARIRSFGVPYLAPLAPLHLGDFKDVLVRAPWWEMDERPGEVGKINRRRKAPGLKPAPPADGSGNKEDKK